uniref:Uncharacterized protein LOC111111101 isoform X1 n=1 Tax=Crassostrea virginica TaxID=6565 RepID=A0A8B8BJQ6_CRAVI|nr:uncharacterized protein LOC111111101 isoform X1 [Crassostrea virginica]
MNGISYTGTGNDNSTGVEITSSTSSGSSWTADVIWYCIMIPVVEVLLQEMPVIMEFVFKKVCIPYIFQYMRCHFLVEKRVQQLGRKNSPVHQWIIHVSMTRQWRRLRQVMLMMEQNISSGNISSWIQRTTK